jgi:DHA1 family multidrug resistance protein-like MFS transporter
MIRIAWPLRQRERNLLVLTIGQFTAQLAFFTILPLLPLFARDLGATTPEEMALWAGLAIGITPLFGALTTPWWGRWAARHGYKRSLERVLAGMSIVMALIVVAGALWQVVALRAVLGALGAFNALVIAATLIASQREQATRAVARVQAAHAAAMVVGPLLGGVLGDHVGIRPTLALSALLYVATLVLIRSHFREVPAAVSAASGRAAPVTLRWLVPLGFALFAVQFADSSLSPILPGFLLDLAAPPAWLATLTGLMVSVGALAAAIGARVVSRHCPRAQLARALPCALVLAALCWVGLALVGVWWQAPVWRVAAALFAGAVPTLVYGLAAQRVDGPAIGLLVTRLTIATGLGAALGPVSAGVLFGGAARTAMAFDGLLALAAALALWATSGAWQPGLAAVRRSLRTALARLQPSNR